MIETQNLTCADRGLSVAPLYHAAELLHYKFVLELPKTDTGKVIKYLLKKLYEEG